MKYPDTGKPALTPETDNAMKQMLCFSDHPAVECLSDLARNLERQRDALAVLLPDITQILDVVRQEWMAENSWSEWDQSVRDRISAALSLVKRGGDSNDN